MPQKAFKGVFFANEMVINGDSRCPLQVRLASNTRPSAFGVFLLNSESLGKESINFTFPHLLRGRR